MNYYPREPFEALACATGQDPKAAESRFEADLLRIMELQTAIVPIFPQPIQRGVVVGDES